MFSDVDSTFSPVRWTTCSLNLGPFTQLKLVQKAAVPSGPGGRPAQDDGSGTLQDPAFAVADATQDVRPIAVCLANTDN